MNLDYLSLSQHNALNFIAWCFDYTHLNSDLVSKALTAAVSYHKDNGISFDRKLFPTIKRHIDGFRSERPPQRRPKLPFSEYHVQKVFQFCVDTHNYDDILVSCALLIGYSLLLRPGEIGYKPESQEKHLLNNSINWHPSFANPREISIEVVASKTNRWKHKTEIIYASCNCHKEIRIIPCPVHYLKYWIIIRNRFHKKVFKKTDFIFIHKNGKPFRSDNLNNWMFNAILIISKKIRAKLYPSKYTPHALRQGGCTDMARHGFPAWRIEMAGRWESKRWRKIYINTDWRDIATLSGRLVTDLLNDIKSCPYK